MIHIRESLSSRNPRAEEVWPLFAGIASVHGHLRGLGPLEGAIMCSKSRWGRPIFLHAGVLLTLACASATPSLGQAPQLSIAEADNACSNYASAYISMTEGDYRDKMPEWKFKCEHHPIRLTCDDTLDSIETARRISPLECGKPVSVLKPAAPPSGQPGSQAIRDLPPVAPEIASADNACANYAATLISRTESEFKDQLAEWKAKCERHPVRLTCEDARDTIETMRHISSLNCTGAARKPPTRRARIER